MNKMDEPIIVVERKYLFDQESAERLDFQGIEQSEDRIARLEQNMASHYQIMRRGDAEDNPSYKQTITYAVIRREQAYFAYERLGGGAESRLHGKLSIGVGGHMNAVEKAENFQQLLAQNLRRELSEELLIKTAEPFQTKTLGFINDDQTEVGAVHLGLLVIIDLPASASVSVKEKEKLAGKWLTREQLIEPETFARLESWSAFAAQILAESNPHKPVRGADN